MEHRRRLLLTVAGALLIVLLLTPLSAAAVQERSARDKFRNGGDITIGADETVPHDLYITGGRVRVEGTIDGDLVVAGGDVTVDGPVQGDLWAAGGMVTIRSTVAGDLRAAGGQVRFEGSTGEDALITAGSFTLGDAARVGQDLIFGAGQVNLDGIVDGDVLGSTGDYRRDGTIEGGEDVTVDTGEGPSALDRIVDALRRYISIILIGVLALALAPRALRATAATVTEQPVPSAVAGIAAVAALVVILIVLVFALILLAILFGPSGFGGLLVTSVVGLLLGGGLLTYLFIVASVYLAAVVVGIALGRLALPQARTDSWTWALAALLLGVLAVVVLTALPVIGVVFDIAVVLFGLGAIALVLWQERPGAASAA